MTKTGVKRLSAVRIDEDVVAAMRRLQDRDGISVSEQIRRALRPWLATKGVLPTARPRAKKGGV